MINLYKIRQEKIIMGILAKIFGKKKHNAERNKIEIPERSLQATTEIIVSSAMRLSNSYYENEIAELKNGIEFINSIPHIVRDIERINERVASTYMEVRERLLEIKDMINSEYIDSLSLLSSFRRATEKIENLKNIDFDADVKTVLEKLAGELKENTKEIIENKKEIDTIIAEIESYAQNINKLYTKHMTIIAAMKEQEDMLERKIIKERMPRILDKSEEMSQIKPDVERTIEEVMQNIKEVLGLYGVEIR